jgi:hypothetical protein
MTSINVENVVETATCQPLDLNQDTCSSKMEEMHAFCAQQCEDFSNDTCGLQLRLHDDERYKKYYDIVLEKTNVPINCRHILFSKKFDDKYGDIRVEETSQAYKDTKKQLGVFVQELNKKKK